MNYNKENETQINNTNSENTDEFEDMKEQLQIFFNERVYPIMFKPDLTEAEINDRKHFSDWYNIMYGERPKSLSENKCFIEMLKPEKDHSTELDKDKQDLQIFFNEKVYPFMNEPDLTKQERDDRDHFSEMYYQLYGRSPTPLANNQCFIEIKKLEKEYFNDFTMLRGKVRNANAFIKYINEGNSPIEAQAKFLKDMTVEDYLGEMQEILAGIPEHLQLDVPTSDDLEVLSKNMINARYNSNDSSVISNNLLPDLTNKQIIVSDHIKSRPFIRTDLLLYKEGEEEVFRRSGLEKITGRSYKDILASGDTINIYLNSYYEDNSAKLFVEINDRRSCPYSEVKLSDFEQHDFNDKVEQHEVHFLEDLVAKKLAHEKLEGFEAIDQSYDAKNHVLKISLTAPDDKINEVLDRSGVYQKLNVRNWQEYKKLNCEHAINAIISDHDTKIEVTGTDIDGAMRVPCIIDERYDVNRASEKLIGMPLDEFLETKAKAQKKHATSKPKKIGYN